MLVFPPTGYKIVRDVRQNKTNRQTRFRKFQKRDLLGSSWSDRQGSLIANRDVEGSSSSWP